MNAAAPSPSRPLLIGGSSPLACALLGDFVNTLPDFDCGPPSNLFCHPGIWQDGGADWGESRARALEKVNAAGEPFLPWCKLETKNVEPYYLRFREVFELLRTSRDAPGFAARFFHNRLAISAAKSWADATPANCFAASAFLAAFPQGRVLLGVENGYAAMARLMDEGFSPKVAAKIWVAESALAAELARAAGTRDRVLLLRCEDLLDRPGDELKKIVAFLADAGPEPPSPVELSGHSQLEATPLAGCENLRQTLSQRISALPETYRHYLRGTTIKQDSLARYGGTEDPVSGAGLLFQLGYEKTFPKWGAVELSKDEQRLGSPRAKHINPLADFKKKLPKAKKTQKQKLRFWGGSAKPQTATSQGSPSATATRLCAVDECSVRALSDADDKGEPKPPQDLPPETPPQGLDLAVVIGFLGRHEILELVVTELATLGDQGHSLAIFLTCSNDEDFAFARQLREKLPYIGVRFCPNRPLGRKWQAAVDFARPFRPGHLLVTGSDDLVSCDYLVHAMDLLAAGGPAGGFEFAAPASWFLYDIDSRSQSRGTLWEIAYRNSVAQPLGAGRVYSARLLDRIDWVLFDETLEVGLDTFGYDQIMDAQAATVLIPASKGVVLSVKGAWQAMESTEKILSVPTIQSRPCDFEKERFFHKHFRKNAATLRGRVGYSKNTVFPQP